MGCVSSTLLNQDDEFTQIRSNALSHHIVSLTSTTYGLLTLDPPPSSTTPPTPSPRFTRRLPESPPPQPEVINSWELMAGLDSNDSFRFSPLSPPPRPLSPKFFHFNTRVAADPGAEKETDSERYTKVFSNKENSHPNRPPLRPRIVPSKIQSQVPNLESSLDGFEKLCPPNGEDKLVLYTTTLRGVRKTFEACNAVRSVIQGLGFAICERDISMDRGFKEELKELMGEKKSAVPPRAFVRGRYVGGADEVLKIHEEGRLVDLLNGLPKVKIGAVCDGCGDCNGSCKLVMVVKDELGKKQGSTVVMRCPDCNENGLVLCPICS
ncbi:hypothetical protein Cgig2_001722 [Carnegiea gigantea]|uniref:Glutaredoxin domain-containing protein n=1 Tax=Carnegiea gigantea TaxID=171969 RepID=A0A9Q1GR20_9CARY|nr:hypothetical protein Cgig2_001722 [Carnegiea gigantea]